MASKFYLRNYVPNIIISDGTKSMALTMTSGNNGSGDNEDLALSYFKTTSASHQQNIMTLANTNPQYIYVSRYQSPGLRAQTIDANTWTIGICCGEANDDMNMYFLPCLYVYDVTGAAVRGYIYDSTTALGSELSYSTATCGIVVTLSGSAVTVTAGDILCLEVWGYTAGTAGTSRNFYHYIGGATDPTAGSSYTGGGSYISTPQDNIRMQTNVIISGGLRL